MSALATGMEHSTIVEGQRLGTVHIMEGICSRLVFFVIYIYIYIYKYIQIHLHVHIHIQIHVPLHVRVRVCLCFFLLLCGAVGGVGWGVMWCGVNGAKVAEQIV